MNLLFFSGTSLSATRGGCDVIRFLRLIFSVDCLRFRIQRLSRTRFPFPLEKFFDRLAYQRRYRRERFLGDSPEGARLLLGQPNNGSFHDFS